MVTAHSRKTELNLRRYAESAGGEAELQRGFETWYEENSRVPTASEFARHLLKQRDPGSAAAVRGRFEAMKQQQRVSRR